MGYYDEAILAHHGILGQKWGVRRFESANGHLTAAGKARYDGDKVTAKEKNAFSGKATGHKALAKVYEVNEKFYSKNNKVLASANKAAKNQQLKKAEEAQKAANEKKANQDSDAAERRKKLIIAGAAIASTALAAYGGYKLYQLNKEATSGLSNKYENVAKKAFFDKNELSATAQKFHMQSEFTKQNTDISKPGYKGAYEIAKDSAKYFNKQSEMMGDVAQGLRDKAQSKNFSVKEKVGYLKDQKNGSKVDVKKELDKAIDSYNSSKGAQTSNNLASEASRLAKSVTAEGPRSFSSRTAQNSGITKQAMANQKLAATVTSFNTGKKAVSNTTKIHGQTKFSQASKANDDLVSDLLKKNAAALAGF